MKNSVEKLEDKFDDILLKVQKKDNHIENGTLKVTAMLQVKSN